MDSPAIDARLLLEVAANATRTDILTDPHRPLTDEQSAQLTALVDRRARREPVSHILGSKGFWKILLRVTPDVLTPRPETETLLDALLPEIPLDRPLRVLDLGVGSGAILLAILAERPNAVGLGVDVSAEALAVARENAANLGLASRTALMRGDWAVGLEPGILRRRCLQSPLHPLRRDRRPRSRKCATTSPASPWTAAPTDSTPIGRSSPQILSVLRPGGALFGVWRTAWDRRRRSPLCSPRPALRP